jgi:hypothetical protein
MTVASRQSGTAVRLASDAETVVTTGAARLQLAGESAAVRAIIRIERPGTYRIASDVVGPAGSVGILIMADDVMLDLGGFSVIGKPGSLSGIRVLGTRSNITVRNGGVRGWEGHGVDLGDASESSIELVRISRNVGDGARLGANGSVTQVETWGNGRDGLVGADGTVIRQSAARSNAGAGFRLGDGAVWDDCVAIANNGDGYAAGAAAVVRGCVARHNHRAGVAVGDMGAVRGCELIRNDGVAIRAGIESVVSDYRCVLPAAEGAIVAGAGSVLRGNIVPGATQEAA